MQIFEKKVLNVSENPNMKEIIDLEVEIPIYCFALLLPLKVRAGDHSECRITFQYFSM